MQRVMSPLSTKGWNYGQRQLQICQFPPQCQSIQKKIHSCNLAVFYSILHAIFDMCENWTFFQSYKNKNISKEHCRSVVCLLGKVPTTRPIRGGKRKKTTTRLPSDTNYSIYVKCLIRKMLAGKQSPFCVTYTHSFFDIKRFVLPWK